MKSLPPSRPPSAGPTCPPIAWIAWIAAVVGTLCLAGSGGCTDVYNDRVERTADWYRWENRLDETLGRREVFAGGVSLRLPKGFEELLPPEAAEGEIVAIGDDPAQPPFMAELIPGAAGVFERSITLPDGDGEASVPVRLYVFSNYELFREAEGGGLEQTDLTVGGLDPAEYRFLVLPRLLGSLGFGVPDGEFFEDWTAPVSRPAFESEKSGTKLTLKTTAEDLRRRGVAGREVEAFRELYGETPMEISFYQVENGPVQAVLMLLTPVTNEPIDVARHFETLSLATMTIEDTPAAAGEVAGGGEGGGRSGAGF